MKGSEKKNFVSEGNDWSHPGLPGLTRIALHGRQTGMESECDDDDDVDDVDDDIVANINLAYIDISEQPNEQHFC